MALYFALFHRHSYTGCKAALSEVVTGATALAAEYNGIDNAGHVRHKLAEMIQIVDLIYAAGIAAAINATRADSGTYVPDTNYVNAGRMLAGESIYEEYESLAAIAAGWRRHCPAKRTSTTRRSDPTWRSTSCAAPKISSEDQHRAFRLFQDMMTSTWGGHKLIDALHGGGSPVIEKVAIYRDHNLEHSKNIAKKLAGIPCEECTKGSSAPKTDGIKRQRTRGLACSKATNSRFARWPRAPVNGGREQASLPSLNSRPRRTNGRRTNTDAKMGRLLMLVERIFL